MDENWGYPYDLGNPQMVMVSTSQTLGPRLIVLRGPLRQVQVGEEDGVVHVPGPNDESVTDVTGLHNIKRDWHGIVIIDHIR